MFKIGDRVSVNNTKGEGRIKLLPGMPEYERRLRWYLFSSNGCVVAFDAPDKSYTGGAEIWFFQKNLKLIEPRVPDWKI